MHKILIGVPVFDWRHQFAESMFSFWTELLTAQKTYRVSHAFVHRNQLDTAENRLAEQAVKNGFTHLLFIEDDLYGFTRQHLERLLSADKDIIGAAYWGSEFPYDLVALRRFNKKLTNCEAPNVEGKQLYWIPDRVGIQEADLMGFGFTLIKTSVFKRLEKPWFNGTPDYNSDAYFYDKCHEQGIRSHVDFGVFLNHRGITSKNRDAYFDIGLADEKYKKMEPSSHTVFTSKQDATNYEEDIRKKVADAEARRETHAVTA